MAPELFPSVPGAASGLHRKEDKVEDRVTEKVGWMLPSRVTVHGSRQESMASTPVQNNLVVPTPVRTAACWVLLQVDVFSFGVVLWEIWTLGEQPYPNLSLQEIFAGVMTGTLRPSPPPDCDPDWMALMQVRVPPGPARRWSAASWTVTSTC